MIVNNKSIEKAIAKAKKVLKEDKSISLGTRLVMNLLLKIIASLCKSKKINSSNSSIPPSQDPNRKKIPKKKGERKPGAQKGHKGKTLQRVENPDKEVPILIDERTLPKGTYKQLPPQRRQVLDFEINLVITEYQAEMLIDGNGRIYTAEFPPNVTKPVQYGPAIKSNAVYMKCFQMSSLSRIEDHFKDQLDLPVSKGSIYNFLKESYDLLDPFEAYLKEKLPSCEVLHADETGINVNGKREWLHVLCNDKYSYFHPDDERGSSANDAMGVLPHYKNTLCHDHWKPYYKYSCKHSLCNAHHLRELESAYTLDKKEWAGKLIEFLKKMNIEVHKSKNSQLSDERINQIKSQYRKILEDGKLETPLLPPPKKRKRGRVAQTKSRNLLERLINYEKDTLRFTEEELVPFTNNQGENDLRMTKVQQKVSGCFRSWEGAKIFARVRSYINTCKKHGIQPTKALRLLFDGETPVFMNS